MGLALTFPGLPSTQPPPRGWWLEARAASLHRAPGIMYTVGAASMHVPGPPKPPIRWSLAASAQVACSASLFSLGRGHRRGREAWGKGCCQEWDPSPSPTPPFSVIGRCGDSRGNRTWNLDPGARSGQGPLSAAARIDTARPWGQISLPKSPWRPRQLEQAGVARGGLLRLRGSAVEGQLGRPIAGGRQLLGAPWPLGHRKSPLEDLQGHRN